MDTIELAYRGRRFRVRAFYLGAARDAWRAVASELGRDDAERVVLKGEPTAERVPAFQSALADLVALVDRETIDPLLALDPA